MWGAAKRRSGKLHRYYRCSTARQHGKDACPATSVRADRLEEAVLAVAGDAPDIKKVVVRGMAAEVRLFGEATTKTADLTPECDTSSFAGRLRKWRLASGLTQRQAAEALGVCVDTIRNWERGRTQPRRAIRHRFEST